MNTAIPALSCMAFTLFAHGARATEGAAGPDQTICATATVMEADPLNVGETGTWLVLDGSATFANINDPFSQVTGLSPGDNVLQWTVLGDGPVQIDAVVITVYDPVATVANAGPDSVLCLPTQEMNLMATPPAYPAIGSWASVGIALIDVFTDPNSSVMFPSSGSVQMIWTVFNGTCGQVSDTAVITVQECVIGVEESLAGALSSMWIEAASGSLLWRNASGDAVIEVFDLHGRRVASVRSLATDGRFALMGLTPGPYVARFVSHGQAKALRFVADAITSR